MVRIGCAIGGVPAGAPKPLDAPFRNYVNHHGLEEVSKMFSTSVDLDQTVKDFEKVVSSYKNNFSNRVVHINFSLQSINPFSMCYEM
jgi:hypothetical protein